MSNEEIYDGDVPILVLVDEEGLEHQFELLAELEINDGQYRVLVPFPDDVDDEQEEEEEIEIDIYFFKVVKDEEGNECLADIDDDEEWEMVADAWQELEYSED